MRGVRHNSAPLALVAEEDSGPHDSMHTGSSNDENAPVKNMPTQKQPADGKSTQTTSDDSDSDNDDSDVDTDYMSLGAQYGARSKQKRKERQMKEFLERQKTQMSMMMMNSDNINLELNGNGMLRERGHSAVEHARHSFSADMMGAPSHLHPLVNSSRPSMVMGPILQSMARLDIGDGRQLTRATFEGYLKKKGQRFKSWKRRYFRLNGQELKYSATPTDGTKGFGMVVGAKLHPDLKGGLSISLAPNRVLEVQAESTDEQEAWLQHLQMACRPTPPPAVSIPRTPVAPPPPPVIHVQSLPPKSVPASFPSAGGRADNQSVYAPIVVDDDDPPPPAPLAVTLRSRRTSSISSRSSVSQDLDDYPASIMDTPTTCEGWLYKQGSVVRNWKKRWFSLVNEVLSYRDMQSSIHVKGFGRVQAVERNMTTHAFGLLVELDNNRKLNVYAEDADTQRRWHRAIASVLQPVVPRSISSAVPPSSTAALPRPSIVVDDAPLSTSHRPFSSTGSSGNVDDATLPANQTLFKQSKTHGGFIKNFSGWMNIPAGLLNTSWKRCFFTLHGIELAQSDDTATPVTRVDSILKVTPWNGKSGGLEFHMTSSRVWRVLCPSLRAANAWLAAVEDCMARTRYTVEKFLKSCDAKHTPTIMCGWLTRNSPSKLGTPVRQYFVLRHLTLSIATDVDQLPHEYDVITALTTPEQDCALEFSFVSAPKMIVECDTVDSLRHWHRIVRTCLNEPHRAAY
ncbi:Aste57867_11826 [Aphanomyces stellatus]|uniref:Aste57867_11826 protein n=1 Tax=Aphanomyces stellatus TaxID=120398 RepID=A0A485KU10_9STRA|nr:hypothetical protein As57867_011781 [Aphanomyces stellatus]VFT88681.1 Aste57867_11826 [Aphanomyces stellatus]